MIRVENLSFAYRENQVLKNVSFDIEKGSWISIIGHNGSGKSTLAKLLVGLEETSTGSITINGLVMNDENLTEIRKNIGIVFQNPDNQFVGVTVRHDIAFGLESQLMAPKEMERVVLEYAELVGMQEFLNKEPHLLSGGQKQRVAIAGTLAMRQSIIIFDEATSMLDPKGTREIISLIKKLNEEHDITVITITHDLDFAKLSDKVIVLRDGEVIKSGDAFEVLQDEAILKSTDLEMPYGLKLLHEVRNNPKLKNNEKLVKTLWEYNLKK